MKICILTPRFPFPENGGDVLRINEIARYLKKQGHSLCLVSFVESYKVKEDEAIDLYDTIYKVKRNSWLSAFYALTFFIMGKPIQCGYYYSIPFLDKVRKIIIKEKPDLFICHLLRTTIYAEKLRLESMTIVEMTDALSKTYSKAGNSKWNSIKKLIYVLEETKIGRYEAKIIKKFPKIVLVSMDDVDYLTKNLGKCVKSLVVHSNGIELPKVKSTQYKNNKICFIGNMRTLQNQDAVFRFVNEIFPLILKKMPKATFYIVGAQPPKRIRELANENIIVTGFVDDIYQSISDSCVAVAPVHIAAGIQNKVLVSMGAGIPVVLSSLISTAIPELVNHVNCFICDDNQLFAEKCIEIMSNPQLRECLSNKGYEMVKKNYSWDEKLKDYEILLNRDNNSA